MTGRLTTAMNKAGAAWRIWAPAVLFFCVTALFALTYHYPIFYFDHWDLLRLYQRFADGSATLGDLWAPHGTHWHAGGYALMLALAPFSGMTQTPEIVVSLLLAFVSCVAIFALLWHAWRDLGRPFPVILFAVAAFFLFSLDQSENWLWGWQVSVFINVAGSAACLALLARRDPTPFSIAGAMLGAALAIYSFATGLALLPAGLVVLLLKRPRLDLRLAAWTAFSVAIALHYKIAVLDSQPGYVASITPQALNGNTLASLARFTLDILGGAVGRFSDGLPISAVAFGLGVGAYALWRLKPEARSTTAGATGLALYGVGSAVLIAYGRLGFETASISRYVTFANFFWIGIVALGFAAFADADKRAALALRVLFGALLIGKAATIGNVLTGSNAGMAHAAEIQRAASSICRVYPDIPPELQAEIAAPYQNVRPLMDYAATHRLSVFHNCANQQR